MHNSPLSRRYSEATGVFLWDIAIPLTGIGAPARQHKARAGPCRPLSWWGSPPGLRATHWSRSCSPASIEQIFPPLRVTLAEHAHQVAAGVQAERPGLAREFHARLFRSAAAFPVVARMAAGHQVLPGGFAGARSRNHVIQGQVAGRHHAVAILAGVTI